MIHKKSIKNSYADALVSNDLEADNAQGSQGANTLELLLLKVLKQFTAQTIIDFLKTYLKSRPKVVLNFEQKLMLNYENRPKKRLHLSFETLCKLLFASVDNHHNLLLEL